MKKYILSILSLLFLNTTYSQVLYDDNFDNYTLGNLGTDTNGVTPGQGGWFILSHYSKNNNLFSVRNDLPQGNKVLVLSCPPSNYEVLAIEKRSLNTLIDQRKSGNDVLKFEIDFFTGHSGFDHSNVIMLSSSLNNSITDHDKSTILATLRFIQGGIECWVHNQSGTGHYRPLNHSYSPYVKVDLPYNTWIKFIIYLDYPNKKIYYETPYLGTVVAFDFLVNRKNGDSIEDNKPNLLQIRNDGQDIINSYMYNKYDNIKITALNAVPPHILSV
ncbi:MAG TPA: hypothetical protein VKY33_03780, partial [Flavobacterium sp.]|nr:hypothetical protein [Flavobacterium sp.]